MAERIKSFLTIRYYTIYFAVALVGILGYVVYQRYCKQPALRNLVLISIDTLRADRLSSYGYGRETSRTIDALAAKSVLFENVVTPAPWTLPAHISMLTGLYPHSHGVQKSKGFRLSSDKGFLPEILKKNGYSTIGVTGGGYVARTYGFNRGFDLYLQPSDYAPNQRKGNTITKAVAVAKRELSKIEEGKAFFLFFHTYDVHCPYNPPKNHFGKFQSPDAEEIEPNRCGNTYYNRRKLQPAQARYLSDRYDESIRAVDEGIAELFSYLKARSDFNNTVIMITSDHGEEFLEHGQIGHQDSLFRELLLVPLIVHTPRGTPQRISEHINLIDIFPTALELLGIKSSDQVDGISLAAVVRGSKMEKTQREFEFSELEQGRILRSRIGADSHLIMDLESGTNYFFDFRKDQLEQDNLVLKEEERFAREQKELVEYLKKMEQETAEPYDTERDEEINRLKALGYL